MQPLSIHGEDMITLSSMTTMTTTTTTTGLMMAGRTMRAASAQGDG
jgi:hypothetical protein